MELSISVNNDSLSISISDPFKYDIADIYGQIERFAAQKEADISGLDIRGLIPRIIRGVAGCENGCPADARGLVSGGYKGFKLEYIEGGILSADSVLKDAPSISIKMFPDF